MKVKRFATYPIAFINNNSERLPEDKGKFYDGKARASYFRMLEEAHHNLLLAHESLKPELVD